MLAARAAKPKLSLSVPTLTTTPVLTATPKSPSRFSSVPSSPSPLTPTARNTKLNQRGFSSSSSSLQVPSQVPRKSLGAAGKRVQFKDSPTVTLVSPMPRECYGEYKVGREERRWRRGE